MATLNSLEPLFQGRSWDIKLFSGKGKYSWFYISLYETKEKITFGGKCYNTLAESFLLRESFFGFLAFGRIFSRVSFFFTLFYYLNFLFCITYIRYKYKSVFLYLSHQEIIWHRDRRRRYTNAHMHSYINNNI